MPLSTLAPPPPHTHSWTGGKVLFASGSPFDPIVDAAGVTHYPAQANNAYIFPAVGYAAVLAQAKGITEEVSRASEQAGRSCTHSLQQVTAAQHTVLCLLPS